MPLAPMPPAGDSPATSSFGSFAAQYGSGTAGVAPTAGYSGSSSQQLFVYGGTHTQSFGMDYMDHSYKADHTNDKILPIQAALSKFERMSPTKQKEMLRLLAIAGFTSSTIPLDKVDAYVKEASLDDAIGAYTNLLQTSAGYLMNSGLKVTPEDVLKSRIGYRLDAAGIKWNGNMNSLGGGALSDALSGSGSSSSAKPGTYTTTTKSVDFLNPADAKAMVRQTLQNELGRDPTQAEYEDFLSTLHAAERDHPNTTTQTDTYALDNNGNLRLANSSSTTHQGIGVTGLEQIAQDKAQQQPGWAEWQAMGTYAPALFQALGASVPGA